MRFRGRGAPRTGRATAAVRATAAGRATTAVRAGVALTVAILTLTTMPATARSRVGVFGRGSWCWFADPRAIHVVGKYDETFVGWIDWRGAITIAAYDARFGVVRSHVVGYQYHDDHSSPSILVEPDQRLTVFWSGHNGP